jgi:hypothetical protein
LISGRLLFGSYGLLFGGSGFFKSSYFLPFPARANPTEINITFVKIKLKMKQLFARYRLVIFLLLQAAVLSAQEFTDSNLPIVIINTDLDENGQPLEIPDDPRILATMKIIKHPDGSRNYMADANTMSFLNYNGRINIEIRGSSSQELPKKQYGLTTLQADDTTNNNVELLGMPSENDWVLNGLAFDPSLIRDYLSYNLARMMGEYAPRTEYCEVVINDEYKGLYILQEKIKADSNRVNIVKITDTDNALPNLTGGYITKADKTTGGDPVAWSMSSYGGWPTDFIHELPKPEDVTTQQDNYIHAQFTSLASASQADNMSLTNGVPSIIDLPSFIDFMIIAELSSNADAYQLSTFFHKDRNGKLRAGPIWDYNLTYGNDLFAYGLDRSHTDIWQFDNDDNTGAKFWKDLFDNPTYRCYLSRRWSQLTAPGNPLKHSNLVEFIDATINTISEAAARENEKWGTVPNLATEIATMKIWLYARIDWMTGHIGGYSGCNNVVTPPLVINKINYNPGTSGQFPIANDQEFIEIKNAGTTTVTMTGFYFRELGITYQFPAGSTISAGASVFLASNPATFQSKHGIAAFGQFTRNLSNSSQQLELADAFGNVIDYVEYLDDSPWPDADGNGSYLTLIDTSLDNALAESWTVSSSATLSNASLLADAVSVYPNPVRDMLNVQTPAAAQLSIVDITGKCMQEVSSAGFSAIDLSGLSRGIYFLRITTADATKTEKIVRE